MHTYASVCASSLIEATDIELDVVSVTLTCALDARRLSDFVWVISGLVTFFLLVIARL